MDQSVSKNLTWHQGGLRRSEREQLLGQRGCVIWFTGLSGSGKSTITRALEDRLLRLRLFAYVLDGDNVRHGLTRDLGFDPPDRKENIRRCAEVAHLFADAGVVTITAFISPYSEDRALARSLNEGLPFVEVYVSTSLEVCMERDVKGLYAKARRGEIPNMTGVNAPYEKPEHPELKCDTERRSVEACVDDIMSYLRSRGIIQLGPADTRPV